MWELIEFLRKNFGVLVIPAANDNFCCQICGGQAVFAEGIKHEDHCAWDQVLRYFQGWTWSGESLPEAFVQVDAMDEQGNQFVAYVDKFGVWGYEELNLFGVAVVVVYWRLRQAPD